MAQIWLLNMATWHYGIESLQFLVFLVDIDRKSYFVKEGQSLKINEGKQPHKILFSDTLGQCR